MKIKFKFKIKHGVYKILNQSPFRATAQPSVTVQLTSLQLLMHILQNAASIGDTAAMNIASRNRLSAADRQRNYLDRMSIAAQQQQQDRNREQHAEARAWLIDQERFTIYHDLTNKQNMILRLKQNIETQKRTRGK
jgi:hypothetical protein